MSEAKVEKIKVTPMYASMWMTKNAQINVHLGSGAENHGSDLFECMLTFPLIARQGSSFSTGIEVQDRRRRVLVISTGSKSVDAILGGRRLTR